MSSSWPGCCCPGVRTVICPLLLVGLTLQYSPVDNFVLLTELCPSLVAGKLPTLVLGMHPAMVVKFLVGAHSALLMKRCHTIPHW